jgi:hypothetical protein
VGLGAGGVAVGDAVAQTGALAGQQALEASVEARTERKVTVFKTVLSADPSQTESPWNGPNRAMQVRPSHSIAADDRRQTAIQHGPVGLGPGGFESRFESRLLLLQQFITIERRGGAS